MARVEPVADARIIVLEGDETGQELLEEAIRLLAPEVIGLDVALERYDLSLANRRRTDNQVVTASGRAMREVGFGLKAATVTPEGADDVGSPNRILREELGASVIMRTGRRIPGVAPLAGAHHPMSVCRMAVGDAYGACQWREEEDPGVEAAFRTERITRKVCRAVAEHSFRTARKGGARVYGGPKWTVSPLYEGMFKEELDAASERYPEVSYQPVLIDAAYAGLVSGAAHTPLVIPALNRDGDCLSELVLALYGSVAGAESVVLAFDHDHEVEAVMAEAPHGTAPALAGRNVANPVAMIMAVAALLHHLGQAGMDARFETASRAVYESVLAASAAGVRTPDLGGEASTKEVTEEVVARTTATIEARRGNTTAARSGTTLEAPLG